MRGGSPYAESGLRIASLLAGLLPMFLAAAALAQERPSESDMFGGSSTPPAAAPPAASGSATPDAPPAASAPQSSEAAPAPAAARAGNAGEQSPSSAQAAAAPAPSAPAGSDASRDGAVLGASATPMFTEEMAPEDPLKVGGQLYLRAQTTGSRGQVPGNWSFSSPSLVDLYLDARPNDRVRGYVLSRISYDPTLPSSATSDGQIGAVQATGSTAGSQSLSSLFQPATRGPNFTLDQLWLRFDVKHTAFLTVGKQHVRWGTGRFWAPTDYLHLRRRNPLDVFDARAGTTMIKVHLPVESKAWNFYAYGISEASEATPTLGRVAGAARAELVLGPAELGLGAVLKNHDKPKYALDLSAGISDFDVYGELALRDASGIDRVRYQADAVVPDAPTPPSWQAPADTARARLAQVVDAYYPIEHKNGYQPQVVGGLTYSRKYNDNDTFTLGAEYFYNALGYASPAAYPGLVLPHSQNLNDPAAFFYLGQHYGSVFLTFPAPFSFDNHTFTLSTLGNLSDRSFITRFDYSLVALTHLRFEAFASVRYGNENGEFRFGVQRLDLGGVVFSRPPAILDFGAALRIAI